VLYCDDCVMDSVYEYYKHVLWAFMEETRRQIVYDADLDLRYTDSPKNTLGLQADGYHFAWEEHIYNFDELESRVIEYIVYSHGGNLGWHFDDASEMTMVIMISNQAIYEGGETEMAKHSRGRRSETLRMSWGDVLVFDARTDHRIFPILNGQRHVFVIEWWRLGRSLRNGRTKTHHHERDLQCLNDGGGEGCWTKKY